jgi:hypothetical protein
MNGTTLEARAAMPPAAPRPSVRLAAAPPKAPGRPRRRTGRGTGPQARPSRPLPAPSLTRGLGSRPQACSVTAPAPAPALLGRPAQWRLTDRGIALVLVTGLLIATAALAVVGLTAFRVTGERYSDVGHSVLAQP